MNKSNETRVTVEEIEAYKAKVTSSPKAAKAFLKRVGIINNKGELTPPYRKDPKRFSYRYGDDDEYNVL